jgi:hypothetical protein
MTQITRTTALVSAFAIALLSGSAAVYANSKERIGIDNIDMCQGYLRDPECTNDTTRNDEPEAVYGYADEQVFVSGDEITGDDEANEIRRRTDYLNEDGFADY